MYVITAIENNRKKNTNISSGSVKQLNDFVHQELIINN